jgi:hypothetical protein
MLDARDALDMGDAAEKTEFAGYADSWRTSEPVKAPRPKAAE